MSEVKPLDWGKTSYGTPEVFTVVGVYRLSHAQNGGWVAIRGHDAIRGADGRDNYATVADAEAAAQADYESRILSALTPTPSRNEVLEEAAKYGRRLATSLYDKHFSDILSGWRPEDDIMGLLLQIDNMTSKLVKRNDHPTQHLCAKCSGHGVVPFKCDYIPCDACDGSGL